MTYRLVATTRVSGVTIPRSVPAVHIIVDEHGKRVDSFLQVANARAALKRLNARSAA